MSHYIVTYSAHQSIHESMALEKAIDIAFHVPRVGETLFFKDKENGRALGPFVVDHVERFIDERAINVYLTAQETEDAEVQP